MNGSAGFESSDDAELWRRILSGDVAAFEIWHARYHPRLIPFLRNRCRPPLEIDDLAQIVWTKVWEHRTQWNPADGRFMSWLFRLADNSRIDALRRVQRRKETQFAETVEPVAPISATEDPRLQKMRDCLKKLGSEFVEVLRLRIEDGLDSRAISERLGIPVKTVDTRSYRGRAQVRDCVEGTPS